MPDLFAQKPKSLPARCCAKWQTGFAKAVAREKEASLCPPSCGVIDRPRAGRRSNSFDRRGNFRGRSERAVTQDFCAQTAVAFEKFPRARNNRTVHPIAW